MFRGSLSWKVKSRKDAYLDGKETVAVEKSRSATQTRRNSETNLERRS